MQDLLNSGKAKKKEERENKRGLNLTDIKNLPKEKSTKFAATATAAPLEDPPGIREGAAGLVGVP